MPLTDIKSWNEIKDNFADSNLLLGNGFSINLHNKFIYDSLFEKFVSSLEDDQKKIFESFKTTNFEIILRDLQTSKKIDELFGIDNVRIVEAIEVLKEGLITTVKENHPKKSEIDWDKLKQIANELEQFNDIYTLSYDALLYHIILLVNDRYRKKEIKYRYNDYFWATYNDNFLEFRDFQNYPHYKHVYYLHGALFIFKHLHFDLKIRNNNNADELLDLISLAISDDLVPLFVSEGSSEEKILSLSQSDYLRFSNNNLKSFTGNLVLYGASLSESDKHIINAINRNNRNIAVSIYTKDRRAEQIEDNLLRYKRLFLNHTISFFESSTLFN
jgi:hypothetical protein